MSDPQTSEPKNRRLGVVILAAGQGTRMRSPTPKVLHPVAGRPMVGHVAALARSLQPDEIVVVIPRDGEKIASAAGSGIISAVQDPQLGTAHAMSCAREALQGRVDEIIMLFGDATLIETSTLARLRQELHPAPLAFLTAVLADASGYGRVIRDGRGAVTGIVEDRDASDEQKAIGEMNSGIMAFDAAWLWEQLPRVPRQPHGEYYLPDLVAIAIADGLPVSTVTADSVDEVEGVNTQAQLAFANEVIFRRERLRLLNDGVTMPAPETVFISPGVSVAPGAIIQPNTHLLGDTSVGELSEIGPNSIIRDTSIGARCLVLSSVIEEAQVMDDVQIGPFSHLRPGAVIHSGVELGNYSEVKASQVGSGTKIHHFSYIGDTTLGENVNVGAGVITCNYDGVAKHQTVVGDDVFIGSDTMLIAPVTLGDGSRTGAGSVVRRDVAPGQLVVGIPARAVPQKQPKQTEQDPGGSDSEHG